MKLRIEDLEGILKEKEERIGQLLCRKNANNWLICERTCSVELLGEELSEQEKTLFEGPFMDFVSRVGGVSRLTMFNLNWHKQHSGRKGSLNAAKLLWGYESYEETMLYAEAYFPGEIDVTYDPSKHIKKVYSKFVLPKLTPFE